MLEREPDRVTVRRSAEHVLRDQRVHAHERAVGECECVDRSRPKRKRTRARGVKDDPSERDRQQDLLPRLDCRQRTPANAGSVQGRAHGVVHGDADDPEVDGGHRPPPDDDRAREEGQCVDRERDPRGHLMSV